MQNVLKLIYCLVLGIGTMLGAAATSAAEYGPLQTINRFPLHMMVLTPRPVNAQLPGRGTLEATLTMEYSNTFFDFRNDRWDFVIDMEMLVGELSMVYGVTEKLALRLEVPAISMQDGFLDGFLENYHDFLGVGNYGRGNRPKNEFSYQAAKEGHLWFQGESFGLRIGQIRVSGQFALPPLRLGGHPLSSAVLGTLKIPVGDTDSGVSSGGYDVGFFLPVKWKGDRWVFHMMPGAIWVDDPTTLGAQVSARNSISFFAGAAYEYNHKWRFLAQLNYYSSPFEKTGLDELDNGALELSFGIQRTLSKTLYWEFAFCEDLTRAVPDFNVRMGVTWHFNTGGVGGKAKH
jgi:hypothetical protein